MSDNILLKPFNTPFETVPFDRIKPSDFLPALKEAIQLGKNRIEKIKTNTESATFSNVIEALEASSPELDLVSSVFFNLHGAESNEEIRNLAKDISPLLTEYSNDVSLDEGLFKKVKEVWNKKDSFKLTDEQNMLLEKTYKSFVRNGANLNEADKTKLREVSKKLSTLSLHFSDNVLKETQKYALIVDKKENLKGLPTDAIEAAAETAKEKGHEGKWIFTLDFPSVIPFLTYAENRELRKELFLANSTKAFKGDELDNKKNIQEITSLRHEKAKLLGYATHADFILEERMASKPSNVTSFLNNLLDHALPAAKLEIDELRNYAKKLGLEGELQKWDYAYYAEKLKMEKFQVDDEMLKPYFKLENVVDGVFKVAHKLYGLTFKRRMDIPVYHPDVAAYEVVDEKGNFIAVFYQDYFPRAGKRNGAWMTSFKGQKIENGQNLRPHVSIVCNFTKPTATKPSLLTFNEVTTLFHEFGHALHGMLANTTYETLSGTNVFWDFVELPSQVMENWAYEKECLDLFAEHFETKEKIPADLMKKIKDSANFHEGRNTLRQLSLALIDMAWHSGDPTGINDIEAFEAMHTAKTDLLPNVKGTSVSAAFSHIFAGGYSAGYYSYKWAEVLDADAFELFKEKGIFNREVADKFKNNVLSRGGSIHPMKLYTEFRGKEPNPDALLRRSGLLK